MKRTFNLNKLSIFCILVFLTGSPFLNFCFSQTSKTSHFNSKKHLLDTTKNQHCYFDDFLKTSRESKEFREKEDYVNDKIRNFDLNSFRKTNDTLNIPIVVHIIHQNPDSITDAMVEDVINEMRDGFAKQGSFLTSSGVDTKIRLGLAKRDPDGGCTNGITRTKSYFSNLLNPFIENKKFKNLMQWPSKDYINIWYLNSTAYIQGGSLRCGTWAFGNTTFYITLPPNAGNLDGLVFTSIEADLWTHEIAHYLGLYHTSSGTCKNDDCTKDGDMVCDTPPDKSSKFSTCQNPDNSCNTDTVSGFLTDQNDLVDNFMESGRSNCPAAFTEGQAERMRKLIFTSRFQLLQTNTDFPCSTTAKSFFNKSIDYPIVGDSVLFTNLSTGATRYEWYVNDTLISTSTDFSFKFLKKGKHKIALRAFQGSSSCFANNFINVFVNCGVEARFYCQNPTTASLLPEFHDSVWFVSTSYNAKSFEWYYSINNTKVLMGKDSNLAFSFPKPGTYKVTLVAKNGSCSDETEFQNIQVLDPTPDGIATAINLKCYQDSGLQFSLRICNNGRAYMKANIPISFYEFDPTLPNANLLGTVFTEEQIGGSCCIEYINKINTIWYKHTKLKTLYVVFNDSGHIKTPVSFSNTFLKESNYLNNIKSTSNDYKITLTPSQINTSLPFDIVPLMASANELTKDSNFIWSSKQNLSCTLCNKPLITIDSNRTKQVIAISNLGCRDTAFVKINVPPYNDLSVQLKTAECYFNDSIDIKFKIKNAFKFGTISKKITVAFYTDDPLKSNAQLLYPIYSVPQFVNDTVLNVSMRLKSIPTKKIFAVINDSNKVIPVQFPTTKYIETNYNNNVDSIDYEHEIIRNISIDLCEGKSYLGYTKTGIYKDKFTSINTGCDSFRILDLKVIPTLRKNFVEIICKGDSVWGKYFKTGIYYDTLVSSLNCDSVRILDLTVLATTSSNHFKDICEGEKYWNHSTIGIHIDTFKNSVGCDSFRILNLGFKPKSFALILDTICSGEVSNGYTKTGVYKDTFIAYNGCDSIRTLKLLVNPTTIPFLGFDKEVCEVKNLKLEGGKFKKYLWNTGDTTKSIIVNKFGVYSLQGMNNFDCYASDSINVFPKFCETIFIPNVFSPNGDKMNDVWEIEALKFMPFSIVNIYDRFGRNVFTSRGYQNAWNGKHMNSGNDLPSSTYYYVIELLNEKKRLSGNVMIIR